MYPSPLSPSEQIPKYATGPFLYNNIIILNMCSHFVPAGFPEIASSIKTNGISVGTAVCENVLKPVCEKKVSEKRKKKTSVENISNIAGL